MPVKKITAETFSGYYFITDAGLSKKGTLSDVKEALAAGVKIIQYRNKNASSRELYDEALELRSLCRDVLFIVNDRVDIACAVNADGVHIGSKDIPYEAVRKIIGNDKIVGVSVCTVREAEYYQNLGADYLGAGPVFDTSTKKDAAGAIGIETLQAISAMKKIPLAAIGGINMGNAKDVCAAGADALCAISCVVASSGARREIQKFMELYK
jgi:thiamine-phosphate pyrophosphorylase